MDKSAFHALDKNMRLPLASLATLLAAPSPPATMPEIVFESTVAQTAEANPEGTPAEQMDRARALAILGRNQEAAAVANAAVASSPYDFGLPVGRGEVLEQIGRRVEAQASYREALGIFETWLENATPADTARFLRFRVLLLTRLGRLDEALALLDTGSGRRVDARILALRCQAATEANIGLRRALSDCNAALTADPGLGEALFARALTFLKLEQWVEAERDFSSQLAHQPENPDALYGRGLARQRLRSPDAAAADIAAARRQLFYIDSEFDRRDLRQIR